MTEAAKLQTFTGNVMDIPIDIDGIKGTVKDYLKACLGRLIKYGENFDGKRPLGNSDWENNLYDAIVESGLATDEKSAHIILMDAIKAL